MSSSQWGHKAPAPRLRVNRLQSGQRRSQLLPEWLKFTACMRAHGIVNYPDHKPIGNYGGSSVNSLGESAHNQRADYPFISVQHVDTGLNLLCLAQDSEIDY